jgi:hydroxymethylpyrimidine kinase/phosphomethylpyrimidine kinase/thiamine-phosphate diphosphorylase
LQADLKTMHGLGVHACTVVSALTVQSTTGVYHVEPVAPALLREQIERLTEDLPPVAVKLGMLGGAEQVRVVADFLATTKTFVVCDPVLASSSGAALLDADGWRLLRERILPRADLLTPNFPELGKLLGPDFQGLENIPLAAQTLLQRGARAVLIKGGHRDGEFCQDYFSDGKQSFWLTSERQLVRHTHGTGCTLASAIAAARALGHPLSDALVIAKAYLNQGLRCGEDIGRGHGSLAHLGWPASPKDFPWLTCSGDLWPPAAGTARRYSFPDCGPQPLGLYPLVNRAAWLEKLLPLGITTIQLRAKDLTGAALEQEIVAAIEIALRAGARLFINDAWALALKHGAYGVHLGQEDLAGADLPALARGGFRLGISTHNYTELARATALRPSYIAIGPVFATVTKAFAHPPLGVAGFQRLATFAPAPVVAIGALTPESAPELRAAGASGFAVIGDLQRASNLAARVRQWQQNL